MAYTAPNPLDRVAVGDDIFLLENLGGGLVRITPHPTSVTAPGTPIDRALLKPLVDAVASHDIDLESAIATLAEHNTEIYTNIPADIINAVVGNSHGWEDKTITQASFGSRTTNNFVDTYEADIAIPYNRFIISISPVSVAATSTNTLDGNGHIDGAIFIADKTTLKISGIEQVSYSDDITIRNLVSSIQINDYDYANGAYCTLYLMLTSTGLRVERKEYNANYTSINIPISIMQI